MDTKKFSNNMLSRMPEYLNYVKSLPKTTKNISATKIANALGLGEVLVRKDLAKVSNGGRCKLGYLCEDLINDIENFLDIKTTMNAVIVGKGDMIQFLLNYDGFKESGVDVLAGFDINCNKKRSVGEKYVYPLNKMEAFCKENQISMGILMGPEEQAQELCEQLTTLGVEAIWNFTSVHLNVPENVAVHNENMVSSVLKLRMQLREMNEAN